MLSLPLNHLMSKSQNQRWESTVVRKSTKTYQKVFETFLTVFAVGCSGLLNSKNHCFPTPSVLPMFHAFDFPHHDCRRILPGQTWPNGIVSFED
jgi:hypothetical protein